MLAILLRVVDSAQMAAQDKLNVIADIKKSGDVHEIRRIMSVSDLDVLLY